MAILVMGDPDYPLTAEHYTYWQALGRFIHRFAMMEQQISALLRLTVGVSSEISQALFSGTRAKQAISWIDRTREAKGIEPDADFDRAKSQFGVINSVRDDVIHNGAILYQEGFLISNENRTLPRLARVTPISADDLDAMTDDLQTIAAAIFVMQLLANGDDPAAYATDWREVGRAPWRYKLPPQAAGPGTPHDATLEHLVRSAALPRSRQRSKDRK